MTEKKIASVIRISDGKFDPDITAESINESGLGRIIFIDESGSDIEHEKNIIALKQLCANINIPVSASGSIKRLEDVKKLFYAGADEVIIDSSLPGASELTKEAILRFGDDTGSKGEWASQNGSEGAAEGSFTPALAWDELVKNEAGLIPVVVQECGTDEVLMVAWMNEEAYNATAKSGRMTYYSRSRKELWVKGETSGHFQYVKSLYADCDRDTLLAKVVQVGAACHTGSHSCFFNEVYGGEEKSADIGSVLNEVYATVIDRKENPREGSYTNYLFDKGIDKILKKVGEEATEIVIAAKNPEAEELKYEISDFLYHVIVLMAERGVSWDDIAGELAGR